MFMIIAFMVGRDVEKTKEDYNFLIPTLGITIVFIIAMFYCYGLGYLAKESEINNMNQIAGETN